MITKVTIWCSKEEVSRLIEDNNGIMIIRQSDCEEKYAFIEAIFPLEDKPNKWYITYMHFTLKCSDRKKGIFYYIVKAMKRLGIIDNDMFDSEDNEQIVHALNTYDKLELSQKIRIFHLLLNEEKNFYIKNNADLFTEEYISTAVLGTYITETLSTHKEAEIIFLNGGVEEAFETSNELLKNWLNNNQEYYAETYGLTYNIVFP